MDPVEHFICDGCKQVIKEYKQANVEYLGERENIFYGFGIYHKIVFAPHAPRPCAPPSHRNSICDELVFIMEKPMIYLLSFLDNGLPVEKSYRGPRVRDLREFTEFMRRFTLPYYEEARLYLNDAIRDGFLNDYGETKLFKPETLQKIIKRYKR